MLLYQPRAPGPAGQVVRGVLLQVALMLVLAVLLSGEIRLLLTGTGRMEHVRAVLSRADRTDDLLVRRENELRGHLMAPSPPSLQRYLLAHAEADRSLAALRALAADRPDRLPLLAALVQDSALWSAIAQQSLEPRARQSASRTRDLLLRRREALDRQAASLSAFVRQEEARLAREARIASQTATVFLWLGGSLTLLMGVLLPRLFRGQVYAATEDYRKSLAERDAALGSLRLSEERFRRLAENAPGIIYRYVLRPNLRCEYVSPAVRQILGYPPESYYAEPRLGLKLVLREDRERLRSTLRASLTRSSVTVRSYHRDGSVVWMDHYITLIHDEAGQLQAIEGVARDITGYVKLETALRDSLEQLELVLKATNDVIWTLDLETHEMSWNEGLHRHFGYGPGDTRPERSWFVERVHPRDALRILPSFYQTLAEGDEVWSEEYRFRRVDGSYATVLDRAHMIRDETGKPLRAVGAMVDITGRQQLEEQLRQSQKMEAVGRLAGGVAHDFNNMLAVISGFSDLILMRTDVAPEVRMHLMQVCRAADRAAGLTRQLLAFSRQQLMDPRVFDLNEVTRDTALMLVRLIGEDVTLETALDSRACLVFADPGHIEQVLMNLMVNARDAMPQGGKLCVACRHVELDAAYALQHPGVNPGSYVLLEVSDTGVGMSPETQARIFDPFFTTKAVGQGTGLGLATVYGIVEQSGGQVRVASEPGQGTTFCIYLPVAREREVAGPGTPRSHDPAAGEETILVVEDELLVREMIRESLRKCGYHVLETDGAEAALRLVADPSLRIDLVLTDVVMPGMSGRELAERVTAQRPDTRVLFMSGYTDDAVVRYGVSAAETAFIQKPFAANALPRKIREVLARK